MNIVVNTRIIDCQQMVVMRVKEIYIQILDNWCGTIVVFSDDTHIVLDSLCDNIYSGQYIIENPPLE